MRCRYTVLRNTSEDTNNKSATTPLKFQGGLFINKAGIHYCFEPVYGQPNSISIFSIVL